MIKVYLDGSKMKTKVDAHEYMKIKLGFSSYYGNNLDALWDELSSISDDIMVVLYNEDDMIWSIGEYGEDIIKVFYDASDENSNIEFGIMA